MPPCVRWFLLRLGRRRRREGGEEGDEVSKEGSQRKELDKRRFFSETAIDGRMREKEAKGEG